jgi:iron transport multicopper oxidase
VLGWTPKAKGALAGSVLSALLGMAAVVWYSMGALEDHEIEDEARRKFEAKQARGGKFGPVKKLFNRQQ